MSSKKSMNVQINEIMALLTDVEKPILDSLTVMLQCNQTHVIEKNVLALFLELLTDGSNITNIIPKRFVSEIRQIVVQMQSTTTVNEADNFWNNVDQFSYSSKYFCPELGDLLLTSIRLSKNYSPKAY